MAGKMCPKCGQQTFFARPTGRECTKCGYKMIVPAGPQGGKGQRCSNCNKYTVFNNQCRNCGAKYFDKLGEE